MVSKYTLLRIVFGLLAIAAFTLGIEEGTEFSADALMFRKCVYVWNVRVMSREYSTPLLDYARDGAFIPVSRDRKWQYSYGYLVVPHTRRFGNGKMGYSVFEGGYGSDIINAADEKKKKEILLQCVGLMRNGKFSEISEYFFELRINKQ